MTLNPAAAMHSQKERPTPIRSLLRRDELLVVPGVFDLISARIAAHCGFDALYMTGYGTVASYLGLPDAGIATYTDMVDRVRCISANTRRPLIADADTGYGGLLNVAHTVRGYEAAGASAIQLEDQEFPKRCGHTAGRIVISTSDMVGKIKVAVECRHSREFLVIARTDARTEHGLDEALRRGDAYLNAGADVLFIESPESVEELEKIGRTFDSPLMANMVEGGRTPVLDARQLSDLGFAIAIFPALGFLTAGAAMKSAFQALRIRGTSLPPAAPMYEFDEFNELMGFPDVWDFERRHGRS